MTAEYTPQHDTTGVYPESTAVAGGSLLTSPTTDRKLAKVPRWVLPLIPLALVCVLVYCATVGAAVIWERWSAFPDPGRAEASDTIVLQSKPDHESTLKLGPAAAGETAPADSPMPAVNLASLPAICQTDLTPGRPLIRPLFSPIAFASRYDASGWPLDAALQFSATITQVQASFNYTGMEDGLSWERVWYLGDDELVRRSGIWDAGESGHLAVFAQVQEKGFVPGRYRLELYVADRLVVQGSFVLVAEETVTSRPVEVAFSTWDGQQHQIQVLDSITGQVEPLLDFARHPTWSSDGVGLLYCGEKGIEEGTPGLWVFNVKQRQSYQINEETWFQSLNWSPHRTYVAASTADPRLVLWHVVDNLAFPGPPGTDPAWSPEGHRLAFRGCTGEGWGIYTASVISNVIDLDSVRQLTFGDDRQPSWSRDGQRIAFVRQEGENQDIYVIEVADGGLKQLTDAPDTEAAPVWSPAGQILFWSQHGGEWGLYRMESNGEKQRLVAETSAIADWTPERPAIGPDFILVEPEPPKPRVQIPPGSGVLVVSNLQNPDEMTFTINNVEHKIDPYRYQTIALPPGHYTWTASWPAKVSRTGIADIIPGQVAYPVIER